MPTVSRLCFWLGVASLVVGVALALYFARADLTRGDEVAVAAASALLVLIPPTIAGALLIGFSRITVRD